MEANKLLVPNNVENASNLHSQVDFEGLFHTITIAKVTYMDIVSKELVGFQHFPIYAKSCKCVLS
jgi:hypothetical protein